jgi:hypothetical protein
MNAGQKHIFFTSKQTILLFQKIRSLPMNTPIQRTTTCKTVQKARATSTPQHKTLPLYTEK